MSDEKTYSEREVAAIIERAVARQEAAQRKHSEGGLNLEDLERVARETGIDPAHLHAAVTEVERGLAADAARPTYTNTHVRLERWVDGAFDDAVWEDTLAEVEQGLGTNYAGTAYHTQPRHQQHGRTREWCHVSAMGIVTEVSASEREGGVRLRFSAYVGFGAPKAQAPFLALLPAILGGVLAGGVFDAVWVGVLAFLLLLGALSPPIGRADRRWRERKGRALEATADLLTERLSAAARSAAGPAAERPVGERAPQDVAGAPRRDPVPGGVLDLDTLADDTLPPDNEREADPVRPRRTRS